MKKIIFASLLVLSLANAWATSVDWSEVKHCDQGYSLMKGDSWGNGQRSVFFQATLSGEALASLEEQLGEDINPMIAIITTGFGHFVGKVGPYKLEIEEHGSNTVSFNILDRRGERLADYQFYNCR